MVAFFLKGKWTFELYCNFLVVYRISNVNEQLAKLKPTCRWWMLNFHGRWQNNFTHYHTLRVPCLIFWFSKNMLLLSSLSYPRSYLEDVRSCCLVIRKAQALPSKVSKFQSCTFVTGLFMVFTWFYDILSISRGLRCSKKHNTNDIQHLHVIALIREGLSLGWQAAVVSFHTSAFILVMYHLDHSVVSSNVILFPALCVYLYKCVRDIKQQKFQQSLSPGDPVLNDLL